MESLIVAESSRYLMIFVDITSLITTSSKSGFLEVNANSVSDVVNESILVPSTNVTNTLNEMESSIPAVSSRYLIIFVDITSSITTSSKSGFLDVNANTVSDIVSESTLVPSTNVTNTLNEMESSITAVSSINAT